MKRRIVALLVACLMVLSLVITSCGQARPTQTTPATTSSPTAPTVAPTITVPTEKPVAAPAFEKPKYGGVLKVGWANDIRDFDAIVGKTHTAYTFMITNEQLWSGDWTRGPAGGYGSNETDWAEAYNLFHLNTGILAESWEFPNKIEGDTATVIARLRKGVRWALNPDSEASRLVNGRELTADDVVFSLNQVITDKRAHLFNSSPELKVAKIAALDKWTVKIEFPWGIFESALGRFGDFVMIVPPEVMKKYGDMREWKNSVGSGPFILTEVIPASSATLVRNPNYWMKDPIGPGKGNQLPYLDGVKYLIIPDISTRYAAVRTAKIDWVDTVDPEDFASLKKSTPQLKSLANEAGTPGLAVAMRVDKKPFDDIRVRRAMLMAIDFQGIARNLYGGNAQILTFPIRKVKGYDGAYLGLDDPDTPESIKELYSYNPEKAKRLLAEAGYPSGFKTWVNMDNNPENVDYMSLNVDYWSKIGVQVEIRPMETGAHETMRRQKTHQQMMTSIGSQPLSNLYRLNPFRDVSQLPNVAMIEDPIVNEAFEKIQRALVTSQTEADRVYRELMKHVLNQAWVVPQVLAPDYRLWWPWLKGYSGERGVGYGHRQFYNWVWLDEALKKSMGY
ncbi:MAG: ABC transporter substrate-binding protein [Chloroflexi bacterium]|nr:ABC transporter substrate-binding protein [Chloroflexota bacterium]